MMRALVADDELETREGLRDLVPWKELGVDCVQTAADGAEALYLSGNFKPDIIITDIRMPRMDGIHYIEKLRGILPSSKIIFISGYSDKEYLKSAIKLRAINYIEKPLNPAEVAAAVQEAVDTLNLESRLKLRGNRLLSMDVALMLIDPEADITTVTQALKEINPDFLSCRHYCTLIIRTGPCGHGKNGETTPEKTASLIGDALGQVFYTYLIASKAGTGFIAHVCGEEICGELSFRHLVEQASSAVRKSLGPQAEVFIAVGERASSLGQIRRSYLTADEAAKAFFFMDYGSTAFHTRQAAPPQELDDGFAGEFENCLRRNDREGALCLIGRIASEVRSAQNITPDQVRNVFFNLAMRVFDVEADRGFSQKCAGYDFIWKAISEKETFQEILRYLTQKTEHFFDDLSALYVNKPVYEIQLYIEEHLSNKTLSIHNISENIHLSPAHICHLFKRETGKTVNQYINCCRIEKAKALLKSSQVKLSEVADGSGYSDANYFTRIFKKITGSTPSEYREKYLV